jgi:hypothetical protein
MKTFRCIVLILIAAAVLMCASGLAKNPANFAEWIVLASFLAAGVAALKVSL